MDIHLKISDTRKLLHFISSHKLVAFDVISCEQCAHCPLTHDSMQIGYSNYKPISERTYNKLKKIMHIPKNDKTVFHYIDVNQLVQLGYIKYIGSCTELPMSCNYGENDFDCDTCIYNDYSNCNCDNYIYYSLIVSDDCNCLGSVFEYDDCNPNYDDNNVDADFMNPYSDEFD